MLGWGAPACANGFPCPRQLQQRYNGGTGEMIAAFNLLASARRRMEMDAAAGWRRATLAREALGCL
jgi:hypothetical protein